MAAATNSESPAPVVPQALSLAATRAFTQAFTESSKTSFRQTFADSITESLRYTLGDSFAESIDQDIAEVFTRALKISLPQSITQTSLCFKTTPPTGLVNVPNEVREQIILLLDTPNANYSAIGCKRAAPIVDKVIESAWENMPVKI